MTIAHVRRAAATAAGAVLALGVVLGGASAALAAPPAPTDTSVQAEWRPLSIHRSLQACTDRRIQLEQEGRYSMWDSRCVQSSNPTFHVLEVRGPRG